MHPSFQRWAEEFTFSELETEPADDTKQPLQVLEDDFLNQNSQSISYISPPLVEKVEKTEKEPETEVNTTTTSTQDLTQLSQKLADEVLERLAGQKNQTPDNAALLETLEELQQDNEILAAQVKDLLAERERLKLELSYYEYEFPKYQNLFGSLYIRR